jgi:hypothetical protein
MHLPLVACSGVGRHVGRQEKQHSDEREILWEMCGHGHGVGMGGGMGMLAASRQDEDPE